MIPTSTTARVMVQPFRGYAALAADARETTVIDRGRVAIEMARFLFVIGAFVSVTATGRLAPVELGAAMISFAYVPIVHALAMAVALRVVDRRIPTMHGLALYVHGYGPWHLCLLVVAGGVLLSPEPKDFLASATTWLLLATTLWSSLLTFACFRDGLGLSARRAALGLATHHLLVIGVVVFYFLAAGQLLPILPR